MANRERCFLRQLPSSHLCVTAKIVAFAKYSQGMPRMSRQILSITLAAALFAWPVIASAEKPTVKVALGLKPVQKDVDYDIPEAKEVEQCTIDAETIGGITGWVV